MKINRTFISTSLVPTFFVQSGILIGSTYLSLYARDLGVPLALASLLAALPFIAQAACDLPGGYLVLRFGSRRLFSAGCLLSLFSVLIRILSSELWVLIVSVIVSGLGSSMIWIARSYWLKQQIRSQERGMVMSFLGGSARVASLFAPLAGGLIIENLNYTMAFVLQGLLFLSAWCIGSVSMWRVSRDQVVQDAVSYRDSVRIAADVLRTRRKTVISSLLGMGTLTLLRSARETLLPLWMNEQGVGEGLIGLVMFSGYTVDALLFWISGIIMTRKGRKASAISCTLMLSLVITALPIATGLPAMFILSIMTGLANALGSGINMTISADLAPRKSPGAFMSLWRFCMGLAGFGAPALASWMIVLAGTFAAPIAIGVVGLGGVGIMSVYMQKKGDKL